MAKNKNKKRNYFGIYQSSFDRMKGNKRLFKGLCDKLGTKIEDLHTFHSHLSKSSFDVDELDQSSFSMFTLAMDETFWVMEGKRTTVFLDDERLTKTLYDAEINFKTDCSVNIPFHSFCVSLPKGTVIDGVEIEPFLVSFFKPSTYDSINQKYFNGTTRLIGSEILREHTNFPDDFMVSIKTFNHELDSYDTITSDVSRAIFDISTSPDATITSRHKKLLEETGKGYNLYITTKLALALLIYNSSQSEPVIVEGYPEVEIKPPEGTNKTHYKPFTLTGKGIDTGNNPHRQKVVRRVAHWRNLRAERFYQGEYSNWDRGSRWVFVSQYEDDIDAFHT